MGNENLQNNLKDNILRTLLYYDIFSHPLTMDEVFTFLPQNTVTPVDVKNKIREYSKEPGSLFDVKDNYVYVKPKEENIPLRLEREKFSKKSWRMARVVTEVIKRCPFVRAVMVTGSLSKNSSDKTSDLDFFVITKPKRLWISRTLLMLFKKIFLLNSYKYFCINYFITSDKLEIEEKNIFTATEIVHLKATHNEELMFKFLEANQWIKNYFPNYVLGSPETHSTGFKVRNYNCIFRRAGEVLFFGKFGDKLDNYLMKKTKKYLYTKYSKVPDTDKQQMFKSTNTTSKTHPGNMQKVILNKYYDKLKEFNL